MVYPFKNSHLERWTRSPLFDEFSNTQHRSHDWTGIAQGTLKKQCLEDFSLASKEKGNICTLGKQYQDMPSCVLHVSFNMVLRRNCRWHLWTPPAVLSLSCSLEFWPLTPSTALTALEAHFCPCTPGRTVSIGSWSLSRGESKRPFLTSWQRFPELISPFPAVFSFSYFLWSPSPWFSPVTLKSYSPLIHCLILLHEYLKDPCCMRVHLAFLLSLLYACSWMRLICTRDFYYHCVQMTLWSVSVPLSIWRSCGHLQPGRSTTWLMLCISTPAMCLTLISLCRNLSHTSLSLLAAPYHPLHILRAWLLVSLGFILSFLFLLVALMTAVYPF